MTQKSDALQQLKNETWLKKVLTTEVKYILGIIVFAAGVVAPYYEIKTDIALIKQNHMSHIEAMSKDILKCVEEAKDLREDQNKIIEAQAKMIELITSNKVRIELMSK